MRKSELHAEVAKLRGEVARLEHERDAALAEIRDKAVSLVASVAGLKVSADAQNAHHAQHTRELKAITAAVTPAPEPAAAPTPINKRGSKAAG